MRDPNGISANIYLPWQKVVTEPSDIRLANSEIDIANWNMPTNIFEYFCVSIQ